MQSDSSSRILPAFSSTSVTSLSEVRQLGLALNKCLLLLSIMLLESP